MVPAKKAREDFVRENYLLQKQSKAIMHMSIFELLISAKMEEWNQILRPGSAIA